VTVSTFALSVYLRLSACVCLFLTVSVALKRLCCYRQMQEASRRAGKQRMSMTVLVDMGGISVRHLTPSVISTLQKRTKLEEAHYPEVCRR
jgi:hypothetical protein